MRKLVALAGLALAAACAPGTAGAATPPPHIARPNPAVVGQQLDYVNALQSASGGTASLPVLELAVIDQAVADQQFLSYLKRDDLGGFLPAPVGQHALSSGGHNVVGQTRTSELPQFSQAASGDVRVFALVAGPPTPPDQGL